MTMRLRAIRPRKTQLVAPLSDKEARAAIREYLEAVKKEMEEYPPERPESTYIRKYKDGGLQGSWIIRIPSRYYGELINTNYYAAYVQGPTNSLGEGRQRQLPKFRKWGWKSITDVSRRLAPQFADLMNRAIKTSVDRPS